MQPVSISDFTRWAKRMTKSCDEKSSRPQEDPGNEDRTAPVESRSHQDWESGRYNPISAWAKEIPANILDPGCAAFNCARNERLF
jgi:hypothetical protein